MLSVRPPLTHPTTGGQDLRRALAAEEASGGVLAGSRWVLLVCTQQGGRHERGEVAVGGLATAARGLAGPGERSFRHPFGCQAAADRARQTTPERQRCSSRDDLAPTRGRRRLPCP